MLVSAGLLSVYFCVSDGEKTLMFRQNTSLVQELSQIKDQDFFFPPHLNTRPPCLHTLLFYCLQYSFFLFF